MADRKHLKDMAAISPEIMGAQREITRDLMRKVGDDVGAALRRMMEIAPDPLLPIAMSAGTSVVALMALLLDTKPEPSKPDPNCLMLAGLLLAHSGISGDRIVDNAYRDLDLLMSADINREVEKRTSGVDGARDLARLITPLLQTRTAAEVLVALEVIMVVTLKKVNAVRDDAIETHIRHMRDIWDKKEPVDG